jgi:putative aldouronate transport system permease protein
MEKGMLNIKQANGKCSNIRKQLYKGRHVYILLLPVIAYYLVFHYAPIYGITIAFKDFSPLKGILGSPWIGFKNFIDFFNSYYFWTLFRNTFILSLLSLVWGFPAPIILALLLNEVKVSPLKKAAQTITYLPHFVSVVVIAGLILDFLSKNGLINNIVVLLGGERYQYMGDENWFRTIFVASNIWQHTGWGSIIYLAALSGVDMQLYEASYVDGAKRWTQLIYITLPSIAPTIITLLILNLGRIMNLSFEMVLLLQNPLNIGTSNVIATFVYERGLLQNDFSYSSAIGLFNNIINFILLVTVNRISRKLTETSLW